MSAPDVTSPEMIALALNAISRARHAHDFLIDALEDTQNVLGAERPLPARCEWGCAIVSRYVTPADFWVCDIIDGAEGPPGIVWPLAPAMPEGAMLLELVTEWGTRVLLTPRICHDLERAGCRLLGITPLCWDDIAHIGLDDAMPSVAVVLLPQSLFIDREMPLPMISAVLTARAMAAPYVLLANQRPPGLPR
ncbi:MAG TPA: hypothetical protein VIK25_10930 [Gemmatimonadaceae bacterium]